MRKGAGRTLLSLAVGIFLSGCGGDAPVADAKSPSGDSDAGASPSPDDLAQRAADANRAGNAADAVKLAEQALDADPTNVPARMNLSLAYLAQGKLDDAYNHCREAMAHAPQDSRLYALRSQISIRKNELEPALVDAEKAVQLAPEDAELYLQRGVLYATLEKHKEALADFTAAITHDSRNADAYYWRSQEQFAAMQIDEALRDINDAVRLNAKESRYLVARADLYSLIGFHEKALPDYAAALDLDPAPMTYFLRGNLYLATEQWKEARADFDAAIAGAQKAKQPNAEFFVARGNLNAEAGDYEKAIEDYTAAIEVAPKHPVALEKRATSKLTLGETKSAIADLTLLVETYPKSPAYRAQRGMALRISEQFESSLADFKAILDRDGESVNARYQAGLTLQAAGDHAQAQEEFTRAIRADEKFAPAYAGRALSIQAQRGIQRLALADLNRAVALDAKEAEFVAMRGNLYYLMGNRDRALEDFARTAQLDPTRHEAFFACGMLYAMAGDTAQGLKNLTAAIELQPQLQYLESRADLRFARQEFIDAIDDYTAAIELNPDAPELYESRGLARESVGQIEKAAADFETAEKLRKKPKP